MASSATSAVMPRTKGKIRLGIAGIIAIPWPLLLAIGAFFGGWELMHPAANGSGLGMPLEYLTHSPFTSYVIPVFCSSSSSESGRLSRRWQRSSATGALRISFSPSASVR